MWEIVLFIIGLAILIQGADMLVAGASSLAKRYKISDTVIGLTVVSLGTSMPELVVNVLASFKGSSDIAIGNIFGSNIANILLILGFTAIINDIPLKRSTIFSEIPFTLMATLLVGFLANASLFNDSSSLQISQIDGLILLLFFVLFIAYIIGSVKSGDGFIEPIEEEEYAILSFWRTILYVILGSVGLFLGGDFVVKGALHIAHGFKLSESFVGLSIVAIGTSLPELVTSVIAAYNKKTDIAVGNIIGSNIFNILWVLGLSASLRALEFDPIGNINILIMILSSILLLLSITIGKRNTIGRRDGIIYIIIYFLYLAFLIDRS